MTIGLPRIVLSTAWRDTLDEALDPHSLTAALRRDIEACLSDFAAVRPRSTPRTERARQADRQRMIECAKELVHLMASASVEDWLEARNMPPRQGQLAQLLEQRIREWEGETGIRRVFGRSSPKWIPKGLPHRMRRPRDWDRYALVYWTMKAFDTAGVGDSLHRDGPRVRTARVMLQLADWIDGRRIGHGNRRLIEEVGSHYRRRHSDPTITVWYNAIGQPRLFTDRPDACRVYVIHARHDLSYQKQVTAITRVLSDRPQNSAASINSVD